MDLYVCHLHSSHRSTLIIADIDTKVSQVISLRFNKESFWERGNFPPTIVNDSAVVKLVNPWRESPNNNAPFDQRE